MKIVILGGSAAGVKVIEEIRRNDASSEIAIISFDGHYPNKRDAFAAFIGKEIAPEKVFYRSKDFYPQNNISLIFDKKISRINLRRKKIFTEDKEQMDYDILVVTDTPENRFPDIKGANKENVFGYKKLKDIDKIVNALPVVKTVVVVADGFCGLQAAAGFIKQGKEVLLVSSGNDFLGRHFKGDARAWILKQLEEKGLRITRPNRIMEILGDKDAKAVKLASGKVFSAEVILFMETDEDLRLFSGSGIPMDRKIDVDSEFKVNGAEGLFVLDQTCNLSGSEPVTPLAVLEEQGKKVVASICGREYSFIQPVGLLSLSLQGLRMTMIGLPSQTAKLELDPAFDETSGRYKKFYVNKDGRLTGAVLVNAQDEEDVILRAVEEKEIFEGAVNVTPSMEPSAETGITSTQMSGENVSAELIDN